MLDIVCVCFRRFISYCNCIMKRKAVVQKVTADRLLDTERYC